MQPNFPTRGQSNYPRRPFNRPAGWLQQTRPHCPPRHNVPMPLRRGLDRGRGQVHHGSRSFRGGPGPISRFRPSVSHSYNDGGSRAGRGWHSAGRAHLPGSHQGPLYQPPNWGGVNPARHGAYPDPHRDQQPGRSLEEIHQTQPAQNNWNPDSTPSTGPVGNVQQISTVVRQMQPQSGNTGPVDSSRGANFGNNVTITTPGLSQNISDGDACLRSQTQAIDSVYTNKPGNTSSGQEDPLVKANDSSTCRPSLETPVTQNVNRELVKAKDSQSCPTPSGTPENQKISRVLAGKRHQEGDPKGDIEIRPDSHSKSVQRDVGTSRQEVGSLPSERKEKSTKERHSGGTVRDRNSKGEERLPDKSADSTRRGYRSSECRERGGGGSDSRDKHASDSRHNSSSESRKRRDRRSDSPRKHQSTSDTRHSRDKDSVSRDARGARSSGSRDGKYTSSGSRSGRREERSHSPRRRETSETRNDDRGRKSGSREVREHRSGSNDVRDSRSGSREQRSSSWSRRDDRRSSRDMISSSSSRDRTPSRREGKRSLSPVDEQSRKRLRESISTKEGSSSREAGSQEMGDSRRGSESRSKRRRDRSSRSEEKGEEPTKSRGKWAHVDEALAEAQAVEALLASFMSTSGGKEESAEEGAGKGWIQSSSKESYYTSNHDDIMDGSTVAGTQNLEDLLERFQTEILDVYAKAKAAQPKYEIPIPEYHHGHCHDHKCQQSDGSSSSSSSSESDSDSSEEEREEITEPFAILKLKEKHPCRLGENLWYNDKGHLNVHPICRCSPKAQTYGIRHNFFPGEVPYPVCDPLGNNLKKLHHYTIQIAPCTNFIFSYPTVITYDSQEFFFEGFSLFSHVPLEGIPPCNVIRFHIEYTLTLVKEPPPENFSVQELDYFSDYVFTEILELYDFDYRDRSGTGCRRFHFMPRFARLLPNKGREILSMHQVMLYLINIRKPVMTEAQLGDMLGLGSVQWSRFLDFMNNMIVSCPGKKPSSIRVDQVDRDHAVCTEKEKKFPVIVHAGAMPAQLTYVADPKYKKLYKSFLRMRHLFRNRNRISSKEQQTYVEIQDELAEIRKNGMHSKDINAEMDCSTMTITGIRSDICQHALIIPVLVNYLRYYICLDKLNEKLGNIFTDKVLLKHAMTHPSYRLTFGMNPDHIRNSLHNCALRSPTMGNMAWQNSQRNRKKGIINLVKIMSRLAEEEEVSSNIHHYERLEFLGDAVVEFMSSSALYHMFPNLEEGGLTTYRQALVENRHLAKVAKKLELEHFMLYSHGPDLCHSKDMDHAVANCLEALIGAIYLERGIKEANRVFCHALFDEEELQHIWLQHPKHPLQQQCPDGDRHMIPDFPVLQKVAEFEEKTGMTFKNIRLLARAFTQRTMAYNDLTLGHNQRMEFLGDSALQLVVSAYLYKHFPEHHEGHLSLLRSSLVNNKTQSIICQDLGLEEYIIEQNVNRFSKTTFSTKLQADTLEALIGALYVDSGLDIVEVFCNVCFFPRLREFIIEQDWNDDKSKLQQVVLTLRREGAEQPEVPYYKLLKKEGPGNSSIYTVAVYFKGRRIGEGSAMSVRRAEKMAAKDALEKGQYEQIRYQTALMSSLYPDEFKPSGSQQPKNRPKKAGIPKQYALPSTRNKRDKR